MTKYSYTGSGPGITFDTYSWDTLCYHATMAPLVKCKFDNHPDIYESIIQFKVCISPSNPTLNMKVDIEKLKSLPDKV